MFSGGSKGNIGKKKVNESVIINLKGMFLHLPNLCVCLDEVGEFGHKKTAAN